ncbi:MAG: acyl-CoA dehydrogenase family protein [Chloroflexota bacterium]|nr:acyl-CoA dehydrogenase family protein [Chloroflexota bacterium]MDE2896624.1 acyl-CoA dehydrogenase family protein [Chloroflexota bacterium]
MSIPAHPFSEYESHPLVEAARELEPSIRACADEIERLGNVPAELIDAVTDRGLFRMNIPARSYGEQAHPLVVFHAIEALAHADASTAWVVMIASEVSLLAAWLPNAVLSQMIGGEEPGGPRCRIVGSSRVMTTAEPDVSGFRLSGRLNFVSGVEHATHVVATFIDFEDQVRFALLPRRAGTVIDTWDAMGLQGTGSHDWELDDAFVQRGHTWAALDPPAAEGPHWRVPDRSLVAWIANAGHAVGTAQGALDDLAVAASEATTGDSSALRDREPFRLEFARAQAEVAAARAFVQEAWTRAWPTVESGEPDPSLLARCRLANVHAVHACAAAVERLFRASGTNAARRSWTLERRWRDLQTARQHGAALDWNFDAGIRPTLGLPARRAR